VLLQRGAATVIALDVGTASSIGAFAPIPGRRP